MREVVYPVLIIGFVLFSLAPTFYELTRMGEVRPERSFELVHNFPTDYNFYLSRIKQGMEGRWMVVERYTSEPHTGGFIHGFYLLLGHIGRFAGVPLGREADVYHVARVVFGMALLVAIAEFCKKYPFSLLAFLLAVTASSYPKLVEVNGAWRFGGYMAWWSVMDSLQRITFIPHILAGQILIVFLITQYENKKHTIFLGMLAFVLGMIFPPGLIFVIGVLGVIGVIRGFRVEWGAIVLMGSASILYFFLMTSFYPWKRLVEVDIIRPLPFDYIEYVKAIGLIGPIGLMGLMVALWKRDRMFYPAVAWVVAWIGFLIVFRFVPQQSPLRFSEMVPHVPLAVLTAYLLSHLGRLGNLSRIAAVTLVGFGLFHMYSSFLWQKDFIDHKIRATLPLVPTGSFVMYPLKDFISAMGYLWDATKGEGVILSETTAGNYIPAKSGNTVYAGHDNTVGFEEKKILVKQFFAGKMSKEWLKITGASYVFFGPQEKEHIRDLSKAYPFLIEVYKNNSVTVYKIP